MSKSVMAYVNLYVLMLSWVLIFEFVFSQNITTTKFLRDSETIESDNAIFKIGFFSPTNTTNRYVGIWYSNEEPDRLEVVWVANRENPLTDSSGVLKLSDDGNLQVLDGQNKVFWSSNVSFSVNNTVALLQDTGNFVLQSEDGESIFWRSFDHPTDSFLPQMKFTIDESASNKKVLFRSWTSPIDPSSGNFSIGINTHIPPQVFMWNYGRPYWRNAPWNGNIFVAKNSVLSITDDNEGKINFGFSLGTKSTLQHFVVTYDGKLVQRDWNVGIRKWEIVWKALESDCDSYGKCGPFGICNSKNSPICGCLKGFVPKNFEEWNKGNWTNGCVRRTSLQCGTRGTTTDEFWKLGSMKVPDGVEWFFASGEDDCRRQCLRNCLCLAYTYYSSIGCMIWNGSLIDLNELHTTGLDLFIRLAYSELAEMNQKHHAKASKSMIIVIVMTLIGIAKVAVMMYCLWRRMCQTNGLIGVTSKFMPKGVTSKVEVGDLPVFGLEKLAIATNHFQDINKLGRGGFGTVYKGKLEDEQEIAVKRLSKTSGQGLQEFMNEVLVISKLQHRNLVKLLGCCIEGEEKMLVYEYMPNKSLNAYLFDSTHQKLLDWKIRFNIILGICRGLLYLHRDSRLRIIHRDLKASNILLDGNLNPKISDFGMAKIIGGNQVQGDTIRVVGTYGYMSPEYAMEGRFSEKSDVFSFGVLLLEILSGRRNSSFKDEESLSLLAQAWKLWNEDNILSLVDPTILESSFQAEILRCIQLGLLCVQEFPEDRPSTSMVLSMIENEISDLPHPSQPGFTQRRIASHTEVQKNGHEQISVNSVSISNFSGR